MMGFAFMKNAAKLANNLIEAREFLQECEKFKNHMHHAISVKNTVILPKTPEMMEEWYNSDLKSLSKCILEDPINYISEKSFMEAYILYPPEDLHHFFKEMRANFVGVLDGLWKAPTAYYKGITRAAPELPLHAPALISDASVNQDLRQAGGAFVLYPNPMKPHLIDFRCGELPLMVLPPSKVKSKVKSHPFAGGEGTKAGLNADIVKTLRFECESMLQGVIFVMNNYPHITHLRLFTDCLHLAELLNGRACIPEEENCYGHYTLLISLLRRYRYTVTHIYLEKNMLSDRLSYIGMTGVKGLKMTQF